MSSVTTVMRRDLKEYNPIKVGCSYTVLGAWEFDDKGQVMGYSVHELTFTDPSDFNWDLQYVCEYISARTLESKAWIMSAGIIGIILLADLI